VSLTCGVDVGGTKILGGVVDEEGTVVEELRVISPATDVSAIEDSITSVITQLCGRHEVAAVGIGAAGYIDRSRSVVMFAPNLAWRDLDLRAEIEARVALSVVVENDANAAAWGEFSYGSAIDAHELLLVAVGTGIGGGVVVDGKLVRGWFGTAGEIGHLRVVPNGHPCGCGQHGCWEQYASGSALVRFARERVAERDRLLSEAGGDREGISGQLVTRLAKAGDPLCVDLLADLGRWLGEGIASLCAVLDPQLVVLGGGVGEAGDLLMVPLKTAYDTTLPATGNRPHAQIRVASLGNAAAIIGAATLARPEVGGEEA
jgi:glucokinase